MNNPPVIKEPLRIEVLSPVHVGTTEMKLRQGVDFVMENGRVFIINSQRLTNLLKSNPKLADEFIVACESGEPFRGDFLRRIHLADVATPVVVSGSVGREILPFIRQANEQPYLPGSTIKGVIRSTLLRYWLLSGRNRLAKIEGKMRDLLNRRRDEIRSRPNDKERITGEYRRRMNEELQREFFGADEHHDVMRYLQLGDCSLNDSTYTRLAEVRVLSTTRDKQLHFKRLRHNPSVPMRINPEIVAKGSVFTGSLSLNAHIYAPESSSLDLPVRESDMALSALIAACNRVADELISQEVEFYQEFQRSELAKWYDETLTPERRALKPNECLLHIAWGSGFDAKTASDLFSENILDDIRWAFNLGKKEKDESGKSRLIKPFPKSRKVVVNGSQLVPLGWIKLIVS